MIANSFRLSRLLLPLSLMVFCTFLVAVSGPRNQDHNSPASDNTKINKDQAPPTADQQKMNSTDRTITQNIRKAIHQDTSLSTYAHNIKVITQDGKVTLRGPVRSEDEKSNLQAKAVAVAGGDNVTNLLTIAPSK